MFILLLYVQGDMITVGESELLDEIFIQVEANAIRIMPQGPDTSLMSLGVVYTKACAVPSMPIVFILYKQI